MRQMKVDKLGIDLLTHDPVVILKDLEGKRYLPILIGPFEATAIALATPDGAGAFIDPTQLTPDDDRALAEWLADERHPKALHDAKGPIHALAQHGWTLKGLTSDTPLERMYREARYGRIYDGPDEVHRMSVARRLLKDPTSAPWA